MTDGTAPREMRAYAGVALDFSQTDDRPPTQTWQLTNSPEMIEYSTRYGITNN